MWKRSFVATTVALGGTVDDAFVALASAFPGVPGASALGTPLGTPDAATAELVDQLRAPHRASRAAALAKAVRDIVLAIDESTLR
jgi:hypothetical protein